MSDQEARLSAILGWLSSGRITTDEAAKRVRTLHFPVDKRAPSVADRFTQHARGDIALPKAGSFAEISAAYAGGKIDRTQYTALAEAAAEAVKSDDSPG